MKQIKEKEVAKQITELINKNVKQLKHDDEKQKNQYESVMSELESEIKTLRIEYFSPRRTEKNYQKQEERDL